MTITNEQREARRKTIGGSDIGAILGENDYKTAYEVWEEKVEGKTIDLSMNKSVVIGNLLESSLLEKYERIYQKICVQSATLCHKEYKFLSANVDAIAVRDGTSYLCDKNLVEIKTASSFNKDEWGPSGTQIVPKSYYAQVAFYMFVANYNQADIFVGFIDDSIRDQILCKLNNAYQEKRELNFSEIVDKMETRLYTFYRDEELEELMLNAALEFYDNYMKPWITEGIKNPPPMDFSNKKFQECIRKKYSIEEGSEIKLPNEYIIVKDSYASAVLSARNFEKLANEYKAKILEAMENNQKATLSDGSFFTRKTVKRKKFEVKESEYIKFEFKQPKEINQGEF